MIEPESLEDLYTQLSRLAPNRRKVLILGGRHDSEGKTLLLKRHFKEWESKGAAVILIPKKWTPHGLAARALASDRPVAETVARAGIPQDWDIIQFLEKKGLRVPVLNFHGSNTRHSPELNFLASRDSRVYPHPSIQMKNIVNSYGDGREKLVYIPHPHEIVVEYFFSGFHAKPVTLRKLYQKDVRAGYAAPGQTGYRKWFSEVKKRSGGMQHSLGYLHHARMGKRAADLFSKAFAPQMTEMVEHLARTGLHGEGKAWRVSSRTHF